MLTFDCFLLDLGLELMTFPSWSFFTHLTISRSVFAFFTGGDAFISDSGGITSDRSFKTCLSSCCWILIQVYKWIFMVAHGQTRNRQMDKQAYKERVWVRRRQILWEKEEWKRRKWLLKVQLICDYSCVDWTFYAINRNQKFEHILVSFIGLILFWIFYLRFSTLASDLMKLCGESRPRNKVIYPNRKLHSSPVKIPFNIDCLFDGWIDW